MIEVDIRYDLLPGIDLRAYEAWAKKVIGTMLQAPGIVEFRASRNMLGSPYVRARTVWQTMADWANFAGSATWQAMSAELRSQFGTNISVEIWGPSPVTPEPIRPGG
jgi:heme-degrading monooxygenase HmoA